ncbi:hypothetical protein HMPREF9554_00406 [Treponema phagedenis F0421]|uniref:DUF721 domain-containing protein n=1 Tax=Treponema phagedenis TaxID=162 RepID=UPI0001F63A38|nr:DUF721 domain-containing protein [Treponema phagedenis]EFW39072.1 hypothetical protein HMPREF9554_00406 [Treponema phagedenis F0421]
MQNKIKKIADLIIPATKQIECFYESGDLQAYNAWVEIVGENIASHSELTDIKNGQAIITVDHSGWSQQILLKKEKILEIFTKKYPQLNITGLSIFVKSEIKDEYKKERKFYKPSAKEIKEFENDEIKKDLPPELKKKFKSLKKAIQKSYKKE